MEIVHGSLSLIVADYIYYWLYKLYILHADLPVRTALLMMLTESGIHRYPRDPLYTLPPLLGLLVSLFDFEFRMRALIGFAH